jgi:hypothetical protein
MQTPSGIAGSMTRLPRLADFGLPRPQFARYEWHRGALALRGLALMLTTFHGSLTWIGPPPSKGTAVLPWAD